MFDNIIATQYGTFSVVSLSDSEHTLQVVFNDGESIFQGIRDYSDNIVLDDLHTF